MKQNLLIKKNSIKKSYKIKKNSINMIDHKEPIEINKEEKSKSLKSSFDEK